MDSLIVRGYPISASAQGSQKQGGRVQLSYLISPTQTDERTSMSLESRFITVSEEGTHLACQYFMIGEGLSPHPILSLKTALS